MIMPTPSHFLCLFSVFSFPKAGLVFLDRDDLFLQLWPQLPSTVPTVEWGLVLNHSAESLYSPGSELATEHFVVHRTKSRAIVSTAAPQFP